jgi:hypothetical protein
LPHCVERSGAKQLIVNHYDSWFLRDNGLGYANECAGRAFGALKTVVEEHFPHWAVRADIDPSHNVRWLSVST